MRELWVMTQRVIFVQHHNTIINHVKPVSFELSFRALAEGDCIDITSLRVEPINIILIPDETFASLRVDSSLRIPWSKMVPL